MGRGLEEKKEEDSGSEIKVLNSLEFRSGSSRGWAGRAQDRKMLDCRNHATHDGGEGGYRLQLQERKNP